MAKDFAGINRMEGEAGLQALGAEVTTSTKQDVTSRFVAMWEKKNAQRALRGGTVSTMALTLAACGGDDDDPVAPAEPTTPVVDLVENAGLYQLASDVDGFTVLDDTVPEITISDEEPDDQITATLDASGAGSGTLVLDFVDENDTLTLTPDSDFGSFTTLEIQDGTVDVSLADLGPIENVTINSGIILTSDQLDGLNSLSGDGDVEVKVGSAEEADDVVAKIEELGVTAPVTITADDDATITDEELDAANTAAEAAVEENNAAEQPSLTADKSEVDEGGVVTFTISTQNVAEGTTLNYTITGVDGGDISGELTGTATVDANGNAVISVGVAEDQLTEGAEDLTLSTTVAGEELTETVTINDTSMTPTYALSVQDVAVVEGDSGSKNMDFALELDSAPSEAITVNFQAVSGGTATAGEDFEVASGAVTFEAGQTAATATVVVKGDTEFEPDETVEIQFSGESLTADVTATGTITNDDEDPDGPQTFTLTTGADTGDAFAGFGGDDTYEAPLGQGTVNGTETAVPTLSGLDSIDAGEGNDTLNAELNEAGLVSTVDPTLKSVDVINIEVSGAGEMPTMPPIFVPTNGAVYQYSEEEGDLDLQNVSGTQEVWLRDQDGGDLLLTNSQEALTVGIRETSNGYLWLEDAQDAVSVEIRDTDSSYLRLDYAADALGSADASQSFAFENAGAESAPVAVGVYTYGADEITTANIGVQGDNVVSFYTGLGGNDTIETVNITGDGSMTFTGASTLGVMTDLTLGGALDVDVSDVNAGSLETVTVNGADDTTLDLGSNGFGSAGFSYTGGDGNDVLRAAVGISGGTTADPTTIDGGEGDDTLQVRAGASDVDLVETNSNDVPVVTGFEALVLNAANGSFNVDGGTFAGLQSIQMTDSGGSRFDLDNLTAPVAAGLDLTFSGSTTVNVDLADESGSSDSYVLNVLDVTTAPGTGNITVAERENGEDIESATVNLTGGNSVTLTADEASTETLTVTGGPADGTLTMVGSYDQGTINLAGVNAAVVAASGEAPGLTLVTTEDQTVTGGTNDDLIDAIGSTGNLTLNTGDGDDQVLLDASELDGDDAIDLGAGTNLASLFVDDFSVVDAADAEGLNAISNAAAFVFEEGGAANSATLDVQYIDQSSLYFADGVAADLTEATASDTYGFVDLRADNSLQGFGASTIEMASGEDTANVELLALDQGGPNGVEFGGSELTISGAATVNLSSNAFEDEADEDQAHDVDVRVDEGATVNIDGTVKLTAEFAADGNDSNIPGITIDASDYQGDGFDNGDFDLTLTGSDQADTITGSDQADSLSGGGDDDSLVGGAGDDDLSGDGGADTLEGGAGADMLDGGADADLLIGGAGNDVLTAGGGDDILDGGAGDDILNVSPNNAPDDTDTVVFNANTSGSDTVRNFVVDGDGERGNGLSTDADVIELSGVGSNSSDLIDALEAATFVNNGEQGSGGVYDNEGPVDLVLDFGGGNTLTFEDFTDVDTAEGFFTGQPFSGEFNPIEGDSASVDLSGGTESNPTEVSVDLNDLTGSTVDTILGDSLSYV